MNKITIGFSRPKKWKPFAAAIMAVYGIPYDHVYVKFWSEKFQRSLVYQASSVMVNFMGYEYFESQNIIVKEFEFDMSDEDMLEMIQYAIDSAGKPYGTMSALGLAVVRIAEVFGKKIKNPFGDGDKTYICCELASYVLEKYVHRQIPFDLDLVSPKDLYVFLSDETNILLPKQPSQ